MIHLVEIKEYNKWLIIKVINKSIKLKHIGTGILFSGFNQFDLKISNEALVIIKDNIKKNLSVENPVLEIITKDKIWWASNTGIIIPPNEIFHIFEIPNHLICENNIDDELKKTIDNAKI